MTYKHFPAPSFNHLIQPSPRIAKLKSLNGVLRGQLPPNIWFPTPVPTTPPSPPPQRICSSKSYKYDNYDKTKYKVSSYCQIPYNQDIKKTNLTQPLTLHDLIVSPHVKHPPKKFAQKILFLHTKLFYEKSSPILFRGGRRHYALFSNLFPFLKVYSELFWCKL